MINTLQPARIKLAGLNLFTEGLISNNLIFIVIANRKTVKKYDPKSAQTGKENKEKVYKGSFLSEQG